MGAINRAALSEQLWPGIYHFWGLSYGDYPEQYKEIFTTRTSRKAFEEYVIEYGFGLAPQKEPGAPIVFDEAGEVWKGRVEHVTYALGFAVTREAVEDNQYFTLVPKYTNALRRSMRLTKEVRAAGFVDGAFTSNTTGDGQAVLSDSHPLKNGQVLSNIGTAGADLNETSLEAAVIQIADWTDERGLRISVRPVKMHVPNGLQFTAERLLKTTDRRVGTGDNDISAISSMGVVPQGYAVNNYLADSRAWFLTTDVPDGMTFWERRALDLDEGDGLDTQVMKVVSSERYAFSCMDWRGFWGMAGA